MGALQGGSTIVSFSPNDVRYRLLAKGAIQSLMTLCGIRRARVRVAEHTFDELTVYVDWSPDEL